MKIKICTKEEFIKAKIESVEKWLDLKERLEDFLKDERYRVITSNIFDPLEVHLKQKVEQLERAIDEIVNYIIGLEDSDLKGGIEI